MVKKLEQISTGEVQKPSKPGQRMTKEELARILPDIIARDSEMITGRFRIMEKQHCFNNEKLRFGFKAYKGEYKMYELLHNEIYQLPRAVVRHLNKGCCSLEYQDLQSPFASEGTKAGVNDGHMHAATMQSCRRIPRFSFTPIDYDNDYDDFMPSQIIEVTNKPLAV